MCMMAFDVPPSRSAGETEEELLQGAPPSRSAGDTVVDHRRVWTALLPAVGEATEQFVLRRSGLVPLVSAYLFLVDSTGDVERGFGVQHVARVIFMRRTWASMAFSSSVVAADRDHTDPNRKRVSFAPGVTVLGDEKDDDADDASKEYSDESDESDSVVFMGQRNLGHPPRPSRSAGRRAPAAAQGAAASCEGNEPRRRTRSSRGVMKLHRDVWRRILAALWRCRSNSCRWGRRRTR